MTKWVTPNNAHRVRYHTTKDCEYCPDDAIPLEDTDERRILTKCRICAGESLADQLEDIGNSYEPR